MFTELESINSRPEPFQYYTADELWTNEHTSQQMLAFHLDEEVDVSSRNAAFVRRSVDWIISNFGLGPDKAVADFGCGPGLYTLPLAQAGGKVTGIDFSPRSLAYARDAAATAGVAIDYVQQNYLEFETEAHFDLILMVMCDLCALSPLQRQGLLEKFHSLLRPGGSVLLDVYSLQAFEMREEVAVYERNLLNGFWSPTPYFGFLNTFKYDDAKVVLDKYTIVEPDETRTIYNWLQYYSPQTLTDEFAKAGLKVNGLYADVAGTPFDPKASEFAVVASKS